MGMNHCARENITDFSCAQAELHEYNDTIQINTSQVKSCSNKAKSSYYRAAKVGRLASKEAKL